MLFGFLKKNLEGRHRLRHLFVQQSCPPEAAAAASLEHEHETERGLDELQGRLRSDLGPDVQARCFGRPDLSRGQETEATAGPP